MYRMAVMSLTITDPTVNKDRCFARTIPPLIYQRQSCLIHSHRYEQFSHAYTNFIMCRCIKLALVHDMAECIVGDIAPSDNISKAEKRRREEASATTTTHCPCGTIMS